MNCELFIADSSIVGDRVENVVVSRSIEEVDEGGRTLGKIVVIDFPSLSTVHVYHTNTDLQSRCQSTDVNVVTLAIHGVYLLQG